MTNGGGALVVCAGSGSSWLAAPVSRPHSRKAAWAHDRNVEKVRLGSSVHWTLVSLISTLSGCCIFSNCLTGLGLNPCLRSRLRLSRKGAGGVLLAKARSGTGPTRSRLRRAWGGPTLCREVPRSSRDKSSEGGGDMGFSPVFGESEEPVSKHLVGLRPTHFCDRYAVACSQREHSECCCTDLSTGIGVKYVLNIVLRCG